MNSLWNFIGKRRFLNRKFRSFQPDILEVHFSESKSICVDPKDLYGPSFYVMHGGEAAFYHYEETVKAEIIEHLPSNGLFFDVGANIGLISLFVSRFRKDVQVFSFEPSTVTSLALENTIKKNEIKNISLIKLGVADKSAENITFFTDSKSSGGNSLIKSAVGHEVLSSDTISLISIDDFVKQSGKIPSVIKVDVQDAEGLVVAGAKNTIEQYSPTFIIEVNNELFLKDTSIFIKNFKGYSVHRVDSDEKVTIDLFPGLAKKCFELNNSIHTDYVFSK